MNLLNAANDLRNALATISGLRVPAWGVEAAPPCALVPLPAEINYLETYGRGMDRIPDWSLWVCVGAGGSDRSAYAALAAYANGSGAKSVKQVMEAYAYTAVGGVTVKSVEFIEQAKLKGHPVYVAEFHLDVIGPGA